VSNAAAAAGATTWEVFATNFGQLVQLLYYDEDSKSDDDKLNDVVEDVAVCQYGRRSLAFEGFIGLAVEAT
jgi:hypothetical protein